MSQPLSIPDSHRDLLERPIDVALVTLMPSGQPQATVVWCALEAGFLTINTMKGYRKERNMRARPRVAVLAVDPDDPLRWIEVEGTVGLVDDGAEAHLRRLAYLYTGAEPEEYPESEVPVIGRIYPTRVRNENSTWGRANAANSSTASTPPGHRSAASTIKPTVAVPESHLDLLARPLTAGLATILPNGFPQAEPVRAGFDGTNIVLRLTNAQAETSHLATGSPATLLIIDPDDTTRWMEIRGEAETTQNGARQLPDRLAPSHAGDGRCPSEDAALCRIRPTRVHLDAIRR